MINDFEKMIDDELPDKQHITRHLSINTMRLFEIMHIARSRQLLIMFKFYVLITILQTTFICLVIYFS